MNALLKVSYHSHYITLITGYGEVPQRDVQQLLGQTGHPVLVASEPLQLLVLLHVPHTRNVAVLLLISPYF